MSESTPETDAIPQPVTAPASSAAPKSIRSRGPFFWVAILCFIVLGVPLLLYIVALCYVSFGFLDSDITAKLSKAFDSPARIKQVSTSWLRNLRMEDVAVEGKDKSQPLSLGAVTLDWDIGPLLNDKRIRSATIERPQIRVRRDENGEWNWKLKPQPKVEGALSIEKILVREGDLRIEYGPGKLLRLQGFSASTTDPGPLLPQPFNFTGVFDSLENVTLSGSNGPGAAWQARALGGVNIERDLGVKQPAGHLTFDLTGRREALSVDNTRGGPIGFQGRIGFDKFNMKLSPSMALDLPRNTLALRGTGMPGSGDDVFIFDELNLQLEGLGHLHGPGVWRKTPDAHLSFTSISGALDIAKLNELFAPRLWNNKVALSGALNVNNLSMLVPMGDKSPVSIFSSDLSVKAAQVMFDQLGNLPPVDLSGHLNWPALETIQLKIGDLGTARLSISHLMPPGSNLPLEIARRTVAQELDLDIGRFWESEIGRRVLSATFDRSKPVPAVSDMDIVLKGNLQGRDLKLSVVENDGVVSQLSLNGLKLRGAGVARWQLPFTVPAKKVMGDLNLVAGFGNNLMQTFTVHGTLRSEPAPALRVGAAVASLEYEHTYHPQKSGREKVGPVRIKRLVMPLEDLEQILDLHRTMGLSGKGAAVITNATFDPVTGNADGTLDLDDISLRIKLPESARAAMVKAVKATQGTAAALLAEKIAHTLTLTHVSLSMKFAMQKNRVTLSGRTDAIAVNVMIPVPVIGDHEQEVFSFGAMNVNLEMDLSPPVAGMGAPRPNAFKLGLLMEGHRNVQLDVKQIDGGAWKIDGNLDSKDWGGLSAALNTSIDLERKMAGPTNLSVVSLDLEKASKNIKQLASAGAPSGFLKNVRLSIGAMATSGSAAENLPPARMTAELVDAGFSQSPEFEIGQLNGTLNCDITSGEDNTAVNALLRLSSYAALLNDGGLYIPPPGNGRSGTVSLRGKFFKSEKSGLRLAELDALDLNFGDQIRISTQGTLELSDNKPQQISLSPLKITMPDMGETMKTFGPPNLKDRDFWFGDLGLSGEGGFEGALEWQAPEHVQIQGKVLFKKADITLGKKTSLLVHALNGELPVILDTGAPRPWRKNTTKAETLSGTLHFESLACDAFALPPQEMQIVAQRNVLKLVNPLEFDTRAGKVNVSDVKFDNLLADPLPRIRLPGEIKDKPVREIHFNVSSRIDVDKLLREQGVAIVGIEGCTLTGAPIQCVLKKGSAVVSTGKTNGLAQSWQLSTQGALKAPFYGGELILENIKARGLFGPAPVAGCDLRLDGGKDGIKFGRLTERNPQFGKFGVRANVAVTNFEASALSLDGIQAFTVDVDSVPAPDVDYFFDGDFAMRVNYPLVRAAFPKMFFDDSSIRKLTFGVKALAFQYALEGGFLKGPRPKLPGKMVMLGYGAEKGVGALFSSRFKTDIKGDASTTMPWSQVISQFKKN